jgi:hypothetical protein
MVEKAVLGIAMIAAISAPGGYIVSQIMVYRSRPGTE